MAWSWSLEWGEVTPELFIGTCPMEPDDLTRIARGTGATAVLSVQSDECLRHFGIDEAAIERRAAELGLARVRCPIRDFDVPHMRERLPEAVTALAAMRASGHRIYVHCTAGLGRTPLTVLAYLTIVEGWHPEEAIRRILAARPGAVPAWEALHGCREDLVARHRAAIERRAYGLHRRGVHGDALADWCQAEDEVLREVLSA